MKRPARLTGALLAKKGHAAPAQALSHAHFSFAEPLAASEGDDGFALAAATIPPYSEALAASGAAADGGNAPHGASQKLRVFGRRPTAPADISARRAAMTVRLDEEHHLRLRVFSAHSKRSSQDILIQALDDYLDRHSHDAGMRHCDCLHKPGGKR